MRRFALLVVWATLPFGLSAGRLTLRDGTVIFGQFISGTAQNITFQDDNGVRRRFDLNQIDTIDFSDLDTPARQDLRRGSQSDQRDRDNNSADRIDNRQPQGEWVSVPAGSSISVRTAEDITFANRRGRPDLSRDDRAGRDGRHWKCGDPARIRGCPDHTPGE